MGLQVPEFPINMWVNMISKSAHTTLSSEQPIEKGWSNSCALFIGSSNDLLQMWVNDWLYQSSSFFYLITNPTLSVAQRNFRDAGQTTSGPGSFTLPFLSFKPWESCWFVSEILGISASRLFSEKNNNPPLHVQYLGLRSNVILAHVCYVMI